MNKILLLLIFPCVIYSQELKTFKGKYENGYANYQYYENENLDRIYHGNFEYTTNYGYEGYKGNYENGKRVGIWKSFYYTSNKEKLFEAEGSIKDETKNGKWEFKVNDLKSKKNKNYTFYFKNDTIINLNLNHPNFKVQTDSVGRLKGNILLKYFSNPSYADPYNENPDNEIIMEVYKNVVIKYIERKLSTGEFQIKYLPKKEDICNLVDNINTNFSLVNDNYNGTNLLFQYKNSEREPIYDEDTGDEIVLKSNDNGESIIFSSNELLNAISKVIKKTFWKGLCIPNLNKMHFSQILFLTEKKK